MPKNDIDYSSTIIYKIICKDECITELYVGHTTNFVQRKYQHKIACNDLNNKCKLYETIRKNGGWQNWNMEIVNFFNCSDSCEARKKEQEYFITLNATLNSVEPFPTPKAKLKKPVIESQNDAISSVLDATLDNLSAEKNAKFFCNYCNFKTHNKNSFNIHISRPKHIRITKNLAIDAEKKCDPNPYLCCCGKKYLYSSGLSKHKKYCEANKKSKDQLPKNEVIGSQDLIMYLMKENKEFKELLIEQNSKIMELAKEAKVINNTTNHTNNTNNTNNNNFNMSIFLNEKCANALNIMEFVNQMNLQLGDLESIGQLGYVNGISKIFVRELKELDVTKRPIHCSDLKREVMYIKNNNEWEKDNEERENMKKAIKYVSQKNMKQLKEWKEQNPEFMDSQSKKNVQFSKIMTNSCGATDEEDEKFFSKIIKNVAKEVVVEK